MPHQRPIIHLPQTHRRLISKRHPLRTLLPPILYPYRPPDPIYKTGLIKLDTALSNTNPAQTLPRLPLHHRRPLPLPILQQRINLQPTIHLIARQQQKNQNFRPKTHPLPPLNLQKTHNPTPNTTHQQTPPL